MTTKKNWISMDNICCIISFEGFLVGGKYLVREMGWVNVRTGKSDSIRFNLQPYYSKMCQNSKDKSGVAYITNRISGLSFKPASGEHTIDLDLLDSKILEIYNSCKSDDKDTVAFKGGQVEQDVLKRLGIPYENLEDFGCSKYKELKENHMTTTCGFHMKGLPCPLDKVIAFKAWVLNHMDEFSLAVEDE